MSSVSDFKQTRVADVHSRVILMGFSCFVCGLFCFLVMKEGGQNDYFLITFYHHSINYELSFMKLVLIQ